MLDAQDLKKCRAEANCPMGSALEQVWVDAINTSPGLPCKHQPQEDKPCPCLVSSKLPNCPKLLKKSNFPQIRNLAGYFLFTDTRALSKNSLYCSVLISASTHLHTSTCICHHVYNDEEGVNPESRWKASQLQKD